MKHLSDVRIALLAGCELGRCERWLAERHIARCPDCRSELAGLRAVLSEIRELSAQMTDLPNNLTWTRLSQEITGNIRVGLAAGEAIALFDKPAPSKPRLGWNAAWVMAAATAIFAVAFWISLPSQQADNLLAALKRIRTERIGMFVHPAPPAPGEAVVEASSSGIQVEENGRTLSLLHPVSDSATVSVSMEGSAGVRFVDADTGQVTTNKVYYAGQ
jgi:hypothetical protein